MGKFQSYEDRIEELLSIADSDSVLSDSILYSSSISIITALYGPNSPQAINIESLRKQIRDTNANAAWKNIALMATSKGVLKTILDDIKFGHITGVTLESQGEIFADFINSAKSIIEDSKDVAGVLACAALEDALKKYALSINLDVEDKDMSEVVNALKAAGSFSKPQAALLKGFIQTRNKVFHAEWEKVEKSNIMSLITFVEQFIIERFS